MTEVQVLFRIEKGMIDELDDHLSELGYKTRNEWFRAKVREYVTEAEKKRMMDRLDKLTIEGITDDDIIQMINDWRKSKGKGY
jgi:metal-responsive CopG/Arc/MetJ family transcriptional regulator